MKENWIVPCNTKYYDVVTHLKNNETIIWRRVSAIHKGDIVYLYIALPYQEIKFKCVVEDEDVNESVLENNSYAIKKDNTGRKSHYVKLRKIYEYSDKYLPFSSLKANGLSQTQTQARTDRNLQAYLDSMDAKIGAKSV